MSLHNHRLGGGVSIDLTWLADDIADDHDKDEVIEFIMMIDGRRADVDFTMELIKELQDSLEGE